MATQLYVCASTQVKKLLIETTTLQELYQQTCSYQDERDFQTTSPYHQEIHSFFLQNKNYLSKKKENSRGATSILNLRVYADLPQETIVLNPLYRPNKNLLSEKTIKKEIKKRLSKGEDATLLIKLLSVYQRHFFSEHDYRLQKISVLKKQAATVTGPSLVENDKYNKLLNKLMRTFSTSPEAVRMIRLHMVYQFLEAEQSKIPFSQTESTLSDPPSISCHLETDFLKSYLDKHGPGPHRMADVAMDREESRRYIR